MSKIKKRFWAHILLAVYNASLILLVQRWDIITKRLKIIVGIFIDEGEKRGFPKVENSSHFIRFS